MQFPEGANRLLDPRDGTVNVEVHLTARLDGNLLFEKMGGTFSDSAQAGWSRRRNPLSLQVSFA